MKLYILRSLIESPTGRVDGPYPLPMRVDDLLPMLSLAYSNGWRSARIDPNQDEEIEVFRDYLRPTRVDKSDAKELGKVLENLSTQVRDQNPSFKRAMLDLAQLAKAGAFTIEKPLTGAT